MKILQLMLARLFANSPGQRFLDFSLRANLWLMGYGAGAAPDSSGEIVLARRLKRSSGPLCILDVGANKGQFATMVLHSLDRPDVAIHCFEPGSSAFRQLTQTLGRDPRVKLNNMGVGSEPGNMTLFFDTPGSHLASVYKRRLDYREIPFEASETVRMTTLDEYCVGLDRIHLLKMDVEGHELSVLQGAGSTLSRVEMVSFEFGGTNIDSRTYWRDFYFFFRDRNFDVFRILPSGVLFRLNQYREWHEQFSTTNFVAIRQ